VVAALEHAANAILTEAHVHLKYVIARSTVRNSKESRGHCCP